MGSTSRLFMAALALVSTTAFVRAQDSAAPKPASVATVETAPNPAPPNAAANTALAKSVETEFPTKTGTRGWILLGLVAVALFANITRYSRRIPSSIKPAANLSSDPEPVAIRVPARLN